MPQELKPIRAFVAIALPEEVRQQIAVFQREWQGRLHGHVIRWTPVEQIHLTLRFLGNIPAVVVPELEAALGRACDGIPCLLLSATGSGCFPNARAPRVFWMGVGGDLARLTQLQARVEVETKVWGGTEEREFRAHLTLGRVKNAPGHGWREIARFVHETSGGELGRWIAHDVLLMRSELTPAGARHTELARCALSG